MRLRHHFWIRLPQDLGFAEVTEPEYREFERQTALPTTPAPLGLNGIVTFSVEEEEE